MFPARLLSLSRHARNALIDLRYGERLGGRTPTTRQPAPGAYSPMNSDYGLLAQMFRGLLQPGDVLVDVGSGRGRVLNYWLHIGHRGPIYGLEIDRELAAGCARRLAGWPNVAVRQGDAVENLPAAATLLFLFNPFDSAVMRRLREAIPQRVERPERVRVVYYAPTCLEVWTEDRRWAVEQRHLDMRGIETFAGRHRVCAYITPTAAIRERQPACEELHSAPGMS